MTLLLETAPVNLAVSLASAKEYLRRGDLNAEDSLLEDVLIPAAIELCEIYSNRRFITQTWSLWLDDFYVDDPRSVDLPGAIIVPYPPLQTITWLKYYDTSGTLTTLTENTHFLKKKGTPGMIVPVSGTVWPSVQSDKPDAVNLKFVCGYGTDQDDVPPAIQSAILVTVLSLYNDRAKAELPEAAMNLLNQHRNMRPC